MIEWNSFANDLLNEENKFKGPKAWANLTKQVLADDAMAKEHFSVSKPDLVKTMEGVYFPVIDCQEHDDLHSKHDLAIK